MSEKVSKSETGQNQVPPTRDECDAAYSDGGGRRAAEEPKAKSGAKQPQEQLEAPVGLDMETRADEDPNADDTSRTGKSPRPADMLGALDDDEANNAGDGDKPLGNADKPEDGDAPLKGKPSREGEATGADDETRADEEWAEGMYEDPAQAQEDEGGKHPTSPAGSTSDTDELPDERKSSAP